MLIIVELDLVAMLHAVTYESACHPRPSLTQLGSASQPPSRNITIAHRCHYPAPPCPNHKHRHCYFIPSPDVPLFCSSRSVAAYSPLHGVGAGFLTDRCLRDHNLTQLYRRHYPVIHFSL
ncbi:Protein of unknown function [Pyronema omphalodes CBS 100304]|uniref:Secreted protein n=1 Tax=Pyronema omphalodes (strain CBS 100304) TaxID=1076935 RepID=U4LJD3_PYROM|nr:Protein of unknown function [Pyronema omphalodes CBS 100304]